MEGKSETTKVVKADTEEASDADGSENAEFPNEEAIMQAVLADEMAAEQAEAAEAEEEQEQEGSLLKRLFFGR